MHKQLEEVLDTEVRPYLREHGGEIEISDFANGILRVRMFGGCSNCPSVQITLKEIVCQAVKGRCPQVEEVILDESVSEGLVDFAKELLGLTT